MPYSQRGGNPEPGQYLLYYQLAILSSQGPSTSWKLTTVTRYSALYLSSDLTWKLQRLHHRGTEQAAYKQQVGRNPSLVYVRREQQNLGAKSGVTHFIPIESQEYALFQPKTSFLSPYKEQDLITKELLSKGHNILQSSKKPKQTKKELNEVPHCPVLGYSEIRWLRSTGLLFPLQEGRGASSALSNWWRACDLQQHWFLPLILLYWCCWIN